MFVNHFYKTLMRKKNKCVLGSLTPGVWSWSQGKVIANPEYGCHLEVKEKGVILIMSMSRKAKAS